MSAPSPPAPAELRALAARLAHDVGKQITRGACNVRAREQVPAALAALIARDLYELSGGQRASARFAQLMAPLRGTAEPPELARCAELLSAIDALEPMVRAGDEPSLRHAAALAREVQALIDAFARGVEAGPP